MIWCAQLFCQNGKPCIKESRKLMVREQGDTSTASPLPQSLAYLVYLVFLVYLVYLVYRIPLYTWYTSPHIPCIPCIPSIPGGKWHTIVKSNVPMASESVIHWITSLSQSREESIVWKESRELQDTCHWSCVPPAPTIASCIPGTGKDKGDIPKTSHTKHSKGKWTTMKDLGRKGMEN